MQNSGITLSLFTPTKNELDWENVCENDNFTLHSRFYEYTVEYNIFYQGVA